MTAREINASSVRGDSKKQKDLDFSDFADRVSWLRSPLRRCYSYLNATIGSTLVARRAGI